MRSSLIVGAAGAAFLWAADAQAELTRSECLDLLVLSERVKEQTEATMQRLHSALVELDRTQTAEDDAEANRQAGAALSTWSELTIGMRNRWRELDEELGDLCRDTF